MKNKCKCLLSKYKDFRWLLCYIKKLLSENISDFHAFWNIGVYMGHFSSIFEHINYNSFPMQKRCYFYTLMRWWKKEDFLQSCKPLNCSFYSLMVWIHPDYSVMEKVNSQRQLKKYERGINFIVCYVNPIYIIRL